MALIRAFRGLFKFNNPVMVFCAEGSEVTVKSNEVRPLPPETATPAPGATAPLRPLPPETNAPAPGAKGQSLAEFLTGSKWLWYGRKDRVLEFRKQATKANRG